MHITQESPRQGDISAMALYRHAGFADVAPFGPYQAAPLSVFMDKTW
jgi:hypothetical protein